MWFGLVFWFRGFYFVSVPYSHSFEWICFTSCGWVVLHSQICWYGGLGKSITNSIPSTPCFQGKANQLLLKTAVRDCFISHTCFLTCWCQMLQCMQSQEKTCAPWISGVTSTQRQNFKILFPWSSNEADGVVGTPSIMLSVSEMDFNSCCVSSIFHDVTVFHISLLKNFNYPFWFESCALVMSLHTCCPSGWKETR